MCSMLQQKYFISFIITYRLPLEYVFFLLPLTASSCYRYCCLYIQMQGCDPGWASFIHTWQIDPHRPEFSEITRIRVLMLSDLGFQGLGERLFM